MPLDFESFGLRVKKAREDKGYSQQDLAIRIHCSRKFINYIERTRKMPRIDTLVDIANVLGISADDLLVDSLKHSSSTADTELHKLLLECNEKESAILVAMVKYMQPILVSEGI